MTTEAQAFPQPARRGLGAARPRWGEKAVEGGLFLCALLSVAVTAGILVALIAAAMGGPQRRLAAVALTGATACWFVGMVLAVVFERPIF